MSRPASRREHQKFCQTEGWELVRDAQGQAVRRHITYRLAPADGRIVRTRISRPGNNERYGPTLWLHILGPHQLDVTEDDFWRCVEERARPGPPGAARNIPADALPADLVYQLLSKLKLSEERVAALGRQEAVDLLVGYWSRAPSDPT